MGIDWAKDLLQSIPMKEIDYITLASNKPKGKRPYFFDDPAVERVLNITMAVASELAVARERVDTLEMRLFSTISSARFVANCWVILK